MARIIVVKSPRCCGQPAKSRLTPISSTRLALASCVTNSMCAQLRCVTFARRFHSEKPSLTYLKRANTQEVSWLDGTEHEFWREHHALEHYAVCRTAVPSEHAPAHPPPATSRLREACF